MPGSISAAALLAALVTHTVKAMLTIEQFHILAADWIIANCSHLIVTYSLHEMKIIPY